MQSKLVNLPGGFFENDLILDSRMTDGYYIHIPINKRICKKPSDINLTFLWLISYYMNSTACFSEYKYMEVT